MGKVMRISRTVVLTLALGLMGASVWLVSNPQTAYAWTCCNFHCNGPGCSYIVRCCGVTCTGSDNVGCTSYDSEGGLLTCEQCDSLNCTRTFCN